MDIKIGDKVRFNQKGLDTPRNSEDWCGIGPDYIDRAKNLGTGTVIQVTRRSGEGYFLLIDFQVSDMPLFFWPAEFFEKVPEEEKLELTQEEKKLLRELVQDKLKGYQELLDKLQ